MFQQVEAQDEVGKFRVSVGTFEGCFLGKCRPLRIVDALGVDGCLERASMFIYGRYETLLLSQSVAATNVAEFNDHWSDDQIHVCEIAQL